MLNPGRTPVQTALTLPATTSVRNNDTDPQEKVIFQINKPLFDICSEVRDMRLGIHLLAYRNMKSWPALLGTVGFDLNGSMHTELLDYSGRYEVIDFEALSKQTRRRKSFIRGDNRTCCVLR